MDLWRSFLRKHSPRKDLDQPHFPEQNEDYRPALLNTHANLSAVLVAVRLLEVVAHRGGTRVKSSVLEKIARIVASSLPVESVQHADEEAGRILRWLEEPEGLDTTEAASEVSDTPELDMMYAADLESRLSVARLALQEDYDLELEYYDEARRHWPRLRVTPTQIVDAQEPEPSLVVVDEGGQERSIPLHALRWLMPVTRRPRPIPSARRDGGAVLPFPGPRQDS